MIGHREPTSDPGIISLLYKNILVSGDIVLNCQLNFKMSLNIISSFLDNGINGQILASDGQGNFKWTDSLNDNTIGSSNLKGKDGNKLTDGMDGQILTAGGSGKFKWLDKSFIAIFIGSTISVGVNDNIGK